jgi:hypothetical protein
MDLTGDDTRSKSPKRIGVKGEGGSDESGGFTKQWIAFVKTQIRSKEKILKKNGFR